MKNRTSPRGWKVSAKSGWILLLCLEVAACGGSSGSFTGGTSGTPGTPGTPATSSTGATPELRCAP